MIERMKALYKHWSYGLTSNEVTNFTYDISPMNQMYLIALISSITDTSFHLVLSYANELSRENYLRNHIRNATENSALGYKADKEAKYGRRLGWYLLARILKPKVIVESGIDKGLGSCVLGWALHKNALEGEKGKYYGLDNDPKAGYLFGGIMSEYGKILYGDSIATLKNLNVKIDLFINDSDHSAKHENLEYRGIGHKLSENAVIVGDNAHVTTELLAFSVGTGRKFVFFKEEPIDHWYKGAGMGVSYHG